MIRSHGSGGGGVFVLPCPPVLAPGKRWSMMLPLTSVPTWAKRLSLTGGLAEVYKLCGWILGDSPLFPACDRSRCADNPRLYWRLVIQPSSVPRPADSLGR